MHRIDRAEVPRIPEIPQGRVSKVLVVDDDRDTAETMAQILRLAGHEVQIALDGLRAVEMARLHRPDFVLLDMGLPHLDGYQVASTIRGEAAGPVVIIAITGYSRETDRYRARQAGCDHHFLKPVDPGTVMALLSTIASPAPLQAEPSAGNTSRGEGSTAVLGRRGG